MASIAARFYSAVLLLVLAVVAEAGSQDDHSDLQKRAATTLASLETVVEGLSAKVQSLQADLTTINNELQDKLIHQSQKSHELEARVGKLSSSSLLLLLLLLSLLLLLLGDVVFSWGFVLLCFVLTEALGLHPNTELFDGVI